MFKHFINLQWKSFFRAASFKTEIWFKVLMIFGAIYFAAVFLSLGVGSFFLIKKAGLGDPLRVVNKFLIYYWVFDLAFRYILQKMPVINIKPLLYLPIVKNKVVHYSLGKTMASFFNWTHAFFFVPFSIVLLFQGYDVLGVIGWHIAIIALIYSNNFINILVNNKDAVFYPVLGLLVVLGICQYYQIFDITVYTAPLFDALYDLPWTAVITWLLLAVLYISAFKYFKKNMYLDAGLATKQTEAKTEDFAWLNRFGNLGLFLKNDIKLIKRNKRSKTTVIMSFFFIFYGLLFFTGMLEVYDNPFGFLFSFGQFVPSWDSSYYPLMMSQNIRYKEYLDSKWYLIVIATLISTVLASFYLVWGWEAYAAVVVGAIYNVGVNSYLVLWGGAYIKTPIDLTSNKKAFGDKQAFNAKTLLLTLPKLILPIVFYAIGHFLINPIAGYSFVVLAGILGFVFKNPVFRKIEGIYKKEKYKTLLAYKQKA